LFPIWPEVSETCCGLWTSDGKYFVFQATREGATHIWALHEGSSFSRDRPPEPTQLTFGPTEFLGPTISPDDKRLFAIGEKRRGELMRYDSASRQFVMYLSGVSGEGLDFSPDGGAVVYTGYPEGTLWRSRRDGSERIQLTRASLDAASPRWSPDGKRIAFMAKKPGGPWKIYLIPSDGGRPEEPIQSEESQWRPNWSPKGDALMFGNPWWSAAPTIHLVDVASRRVSTVPGSQGFCSPRWSPDGRFVAALSKDLRTVVLFDFTTQHWEQLAVMDSVGYLSWSRKGEYLYFDAATRDGVSIYRVSARDHRLERVTAIPPPIGLAFGLFGPWTGLDPDDSPLLMRQTSIQEIYALDWKLP
jgi:Tol biopolymer transport system component